MSVGRRIMSLMLAHLTWIGVYLAVFTWTCIDIQLFAIPLILSLSLYFAAPFHLVSHIAGNERISNRFRNAQN